MGEIQSDEELLKVETDKAVKMWAVVVKDMERLKKHESLENTARKKEEKVPLCSGNTCHCQPDSLAAEYLHECCTISSKASQEGDKKMDIKEAACMKN